MLIPHDSQNARSGPPSPSRNSRISTLSILTRVNIGRFQVEIFSDGIFRLDGGAMFGVVPKVPWEKQKPADELNRVAMNINGFFIPAARNAVFWRTAAGPKLAANQKRTSG